MIKSKFELGQVAATPGALALAESGINIMAYLNRHANCDWGDMSQADKKENDLSLEKGFRIMSSYKLPTGDKLWIITERDRSVTTFLLPEEY